MSSGGSRSGGGTGRGIAASSGETRSADGIALRRLLPGPERASIGPFVLLDHFGFEPAARDSTGVQVRPHPHIGLATHTYLFEGEITHRDSLGHEAHVRPGDIAWMVAGRGIVHSERSEGPLELRRRIHGLQCWLALPEECEQTEPQFQHHAASSISEVGLPGGSVRILAGSAHGQSGPMTPLSPVLYLDIRLDPGGCYVVAEEMPERGLYVVGGSVRCGEQAYPAGTLLRLPAGDRVEVLCDERSQFVVLGGAPLGPRELWWNFVSSSQTRIEETKQRWRQRRFPAVHGDETEFIPLPEDA